MTPNSEMTPKHQTVRNMNNISDEDWMRHALSLAKIAESYGEVPIGAIVVLHRNIIGEGYNQSTKQKDPTAHAEIIALRHAAQTIQNYRILESTLYVTLEPCLMCIGALLHARVKRIVFGAIDPKFGAITSKHFLLENLEFNHRIDWEGGCLGDACSSLLKDFFRHRRA